MDNNEQCNENIFVSIISYRDPECQWTIKNLMELAENKENIYIGVCLQYDLNGGSDDKCFQFDFTSNGDNEWCKKHIRIIKMNYTDAKGPCYARSLVQQQLFNNEKYYLQIDSHMRFVSKWDTLMINQLNNCRRTTTTTNGSTTTTTTTIDEKAILTCYPMGYMLPNSIPVHRFPILLVATGFGEKDGFLRLGGKIINKKLEVPCESKFWVSGFSFSRSELISKVPYDPNLKYLFFGEEISMSARLYTNGYTFYSPTTTLIFHLWNRDYRSTFRENKSDEILQMELISKNRLSQLFNQQDTSIIEPIYNLGTIKTISQYSEYCGVDFKNKTINNIGKYGGYFNEKDTFFMNDIMEFVIKSQIGI